jgi:hypothetical protein
MITEKNFIDAAKLLGCSVPAIRAVTVVESGGIGFFSSGKIILKFEGHVFHLYTKGKYDQSHPTLSYPKWTEKYSAFGEKAYDRFNQAFKLDARAAMLSTSWGMFQIMGENYSQCGFRTVNDFVDSLKAGDGAHLTAFCKYIISRKMEKYLANLEEYADDFAYRYNGALYNKHDYDGQIRREYRKFLTLYKLNK